MKCLWNETYLHLEVEQALAISKMYWEFRANNKKEKQIMPGKSYLRQGAILTGGGVVGGGVGLKS